MNMRWTAAVLVAAVMGGAGLTACGGGGSTPPAAAGSSTDTGSAAATVSSGAPSSASQGSSTPGSSGSSNKTTHSIAPKPVVPPPTGQSSGTHSFTVPPIAGVVTGTGTYTKIGTQRVKVTICATQIGKAYAVGAVALAYNSSGASKNIGGVVLPESGSTKSCGTTTFLFYTAHLKVHVFIGGSNGAITKTGTVKTLY